MTEKTFQPPLLTFQNREDTTPEDPIKTDFDEGDLAKDGIVYKELMVAFETREPEDTVGKALYRLIPNLSAKTVAFLLVEGLASFLKDESARQYFEKGPYADQVRVIGMEN